MALRVMAWIIKTGAKHIYTLSNSTKQHIIGKGISRGAERCKFQLRSTLQSGVMRVDRKIMEYNNYMVFGIKPKFYGTILLLVRWLLPAVLL